METAPLPPEHHPKVVYLARLAAANVNSPDVRSWIMDGTYDTSRAIQATVAAIEETTKAAALMLGAPESCMLLDYAHLPEPDEVHEYRPHHVR